MSSIDIVAPYEVLPLSVGVWVLVGAKREFSCSEYIIVMILDLKTTF